MKNQPSSILMSATFALFVLPFADAATGSGKRITCVGDSITAGVGTQYPHIESWPSQLQRMLGPEWTVQNFGNSGSTLLKQGDKPYQNQKSFKDALASKPDIVVIMLGTNDSKPHNWAKKDQFKADYLDMIAKFRNLPGEPAVFIGLPPYVPGAGNFGIHQKAVSEELPIIQEIAKEAEATLINIHGATFQKDAWFPDRVHPNADGANAIARTVYEALLGKFFDGEPGPLVSTWKGYQRLDFVVNQRLALLIRPQSPAPGNPWIWRPEFFGHEPQADLALLSKGWHLAYINMENMYGSPAALDYMDAFYAYLRQEYSLAEKVVLEGLSRGGLYAFNWAIRHPEKAAGLYVDAPVCDFKSWPGGKGKGPGSPRDWDRLLKIYGLSEEEAMRYPDNPVDRLKPLADAGVPIFAVIGDADEVVPVEENIQIVEERYRALGGDMEVIRKPGGKHHPHSLRDPTPIVKFALRAFQEEKPVPAGK